MKIAKYLILELLFIIFVINSYWFFADMDRDNSVCVDVGNKIKGQFLLPLIFFFNNKCSYSTA